MGGDIHRHLPCHHIAGLPFRHQFPDRIGRPADHRGLRGGEHRHDDIADAPCREFVADLLGRQLDRGHRAAAGQAAHEPRAPADHPDPVFE